MGLDLSIELLIKEKKSGAIVGMEELAYWRKHWGLRDELLKLFTSNKDDILYADVDIETRVPLSYLPAAIELICDKIKDYARGDATMFSNSIWDAEQTVQQTIEELKRLCIANDCLIAKETMTKEELLLYMDSIGIDISEPVYYWMNNSEFTIEDIVKNIEDYEFCLVLINSY